MKYRSEIDGLRALAVLPVLFFHADFTLFSGGFIGVDVFFVISGFLITSIILEELSQSRFSLLSFYERRARRIMPALMFMGLGSFVVAYAIMPSDLFKEFGMSLVNVYTFTSNIYFYFTGGYFSSIADEKPLLHTWSLAIEEQYYLLFPCMLMLLFKKARKYTLVAVVILLMTSLFMSQYLTSNGFNDASFYLISSRAWELLAGSVIAFSSLTSKVKSILVRESLSVIGLLLLTSSYIIFDKSSPLPGLYSLIPVIGTMMLIVFATGSTTVGKILSQKWIVFVGLVSYSLYLWHQPILAFIKMKSVGEPSHYLVLFGLIVSFLFSIISWKYIEAPFRNKNKIKTKSIFIFSITGISISLLVGSWIYKLDGVPTRFGKKILVSEIKYSPKRTECHTSGLSYMKPKDGCRYFNENNTTWAVIGDSHGVELAYSLASLLKEKGEGLLQLTFSACPAAAYLDLAAPPGCSNWSKEALATVINDKKIENVVLSFRYSYHFFGDHLKSYPDLPQKSPIKHLPKSLRKAYAQDVRTYYWNSFSKTVQSLLNADKNVIVVYPFPELPINIKKMIEPVTIFSSKPMINLNKAVSMEYYKKRNQFVINKLDALNYDRNLISVKPAAIFCDNLFCSAAENNQAYYADDNHLSVFGARKLAIEIVRRNNVGRQDNK